MRLSAATCRRFFLQFFLLFFPWTWIWMMIQGWDFMLQMRESFSRASQVQYLQCSSQRRELWMET
jgi:hypothetical protein